MDQPKHILIVEDEVPMAEALDFKLKQAGFATTVANDGAFAIEAIKKTPFDLILLDLILPKVDGFGILEEIHRRKIKAPVLILSNLSQQDDINRALSMGAKDFLVKTNVQITDFIDRVKREMAA